MKKRRLKSMKIIVVIIICVVIYQLIPYSPVKTKFWSLVEEYSSKFQIEKHSITEDDLETLPKALQRFYINNGYVGIESTDKVVFSFKDADFALGINKPDIKIDYLVYDYVMEPIRIAFIDTKIYGIPFQGIDICKSGKGSMKGIVAKHIPVIENNIDDFIDCSYLAECIFHPSLVLQDNVSYTQIDEYSIEATIVDSGVQTKGIFYFNENYELERFEVDKRFCSDTNTYEMWSAITSEYKIVNGINLPTKFQAIWHFDSGDFIYFDSNGMEIFY